MSIKSFYDAELQAAALAYKSWSCEQFDDLDDYVMRQRRHELSELVKEVILNEFDDEDKRLICLHWYEGLTKEQAGQRLGMSRSAVYRRFDKIADKLYEKLRYAVEYRYGIRSPEKAKALIVEPEEDYSEVTCEIARRLKVLRARNYLTVKQVCKASGISEYKLCKIEKNAACAKMTEIKKLASLYKTSSDFIIFGRSRCLRDPSTGMPTRVLFEN